MYLLGRKVKRRMMVLFLVLHSFFLTAMSIYLLNLPFVYEDELYLVQATSIVKKLLIKTREKPDRNRFLFVNVSWEKQLIDKMDSEGFPLGNQVITDREKLASFFKKVNDFPVNHQFLLCDVSFSDPSENDTELQEQFGRLSNYIVSYSPGENIEDSNIVFNAEKAVSGYETFNIDKFIKFKLVQNDSLKSMPLRMYEELHNTRLRKGNFFFRIGKEFILNSFIVDFKIWPFDVSNNNRADYDLINLGDFDFIPDSAFKKLTNNRIIILGDYELNDIHETLYGPMSGPLILLNTFLALEDGDNVISPFFVIYLFICFFLISGFSLDFETKERKKLYIFKFKKTFIDEALEFLAYVFFLSLISSISFFLFNIHLTILLFASYLYFLDFINKYLVNRQLKSPKSENVFYSFDDGVDA